MSDDAETETLINIDEALTFTCGDRDMLIDLAQLFLVEGPIQLTAVRTSIDEGNATQIRKTAHSLKGSVVIFGAKRVAAAATEVQVAARDDDLSGVEFAWQGLEQATTKLLQEIKQLCDR